MDKIGRIKRVVESSLDLSFGGEIRIKTISILPTQKFLSETNDWVPDSYTLIIQIQKGSVTWDRLREVESFLECLLGFECCVDFL